MPVPFSKPATTTAQQIALLKSRGLTIADDKFAIHYLSHIGYYRLAGYWQIFQADRINHIFKAGSTLEEIIDLYNFDRELRLLLLDAIERIEVSLRAVLSTDMCCQYGPSWYADDQYAFDLNNHDDIMDVINKELNRSNEEFIKHHDAKYDKGVYPPAWKTLQILSLGTLSKIYGNIKNSIPEKKQIARSYGLPSEDWLHSWIQVISVLRNFCAHHSRVCYRKFNFPPKEMRRQKLPWIKNIPPKQSPESQLLYYQLCSLKYLLHTCSPDNTFSKKLQSLITKYPTIDLIRMGFMVDWEKEALWAS